jgi:hypothetical protein
MPGGQELNRWRKTCHAVPTKFIGKSMARARRDIGTRNAARGSGGFVYGCKFGYGPTRTPETNIVVLRLDARAT